MSKQEQILIYEGKNGIRVELRLDGKLDTFWATQEQISNLFTSSISNVSEHISNIYNSGELREEETFRIFRNVQNQPIKHYNLDVIIAIGYRISSSTATQFRIWATKILKEYIIKGFAIDDERLKDPSRNQYFEELLQRIREIRASEKLFYQKIKDVYSTAIDYDKNSDEARVFFATVQNKMIFAICKKRAAELIVERADENDKNFGLKTWSGSRVRKIDVDISKNYLTEKEIKELNHVTTMLLDYAELQVNKGIAMKMSDWSNKLDRFLEFNEYEVCHDAGTMSHDTMEKIVGKRYKTFDDKRKLKEKEGAEREAMEDAKKLEEEVKELMQKRGAVVNSAQDEEFTKAIKKFAKKKPKPS
jgi:hypothetical protein